MTELKKTIAHEVMFSKLADGLDSTSRLTQALLSEIRESEADFATIKTELAILRDNVKSLSVIVKEGNGSTSLLTKIALIEQKLGALDKWMDGQNETNITNKNKLSDLQSDMEDIERRIRSIEQNIKIYFDKIDEKERLEHENIRASFHKMEELSHLEQKNKLAIQQERKTFIVKVVVGVIVGVIGIGIAIVKTFFM